MSMENMFNGLFGKIAPGMCRLSMDGRIAVKTSKGYKTYNIKTGRLTNCSNFVFNIGEDFFFVIPTNKVSRGDIILTNGQPKCVVKPGKDEIVVINYEDNTVETILPERHVFMGSSYFFGKIVSMFGNSFAKGKGMNNIMKYMMMSEMMKGSGGASTNTSSMSGLLPMMMLGGGNFENMFEDMFDSEIFDGDVFDESEDAEDAEEEE